MNWIQTQDPTHRYLRPIFVRSIATAALDILRSILGIRGSCIPDKTMELHASIQDADACQLSKSEVSCRKSSDVDQKLREDIDDASRAPRNTECRFTEAGSSGLLRVDTLLIKRHSRHVEHQAGCEVDLLTMGQVPDGAHVSHDINGFRKIKRKRI
jgi:hypothetical protein